MPHLLPLTLFAAAFAVALPAVARDRPGTPNDERAYACNNPLTHRPTICMQFNNTANEEVKFETEFTHNGRPVDRQALTAEGVEFGCHPGVAKNSPTAPSCQNRTKGRTTTPTQHHKLPMGEGFVRDWHRIFGGREARADDIEVRTIPAIGFALRNVHPGDEYCFRARARRISDDVVSLRWSNWACADGPRLPAKPEAPAHISTHWMKSEWDGTTHGRPLTHGLLVRWEAAERAGEYVVSAPDGGFEPVTVDSNKRHAIIEVSEKVYDAGGVPVAVCARNVSGSRCQRTLLARLVDPTRETVRRHSGGAAAAKALFPAAQPDPAPAPATAPVASPQPATRVPENSSERMTRGSSVGSRVLRALGGLSTVGTPGFAGGMAIDPSRPLYTPMR